MNPIPNAFRNQSPPEGWADLDVPMMTVIGDEEHHGHDRHILAAPFLSPHLLITVTPPSTAPPPPPRPSQTESSSGSTVALNVRVGAYFGDFGLRKGAHAPTGSGTY
ncbi:hypothetical protein V498_03397 [Pseudogymnoascus sp. VKM F-4517 (FW-2822)]|nr:hypothetical protein V498_03397 [Pseudogymnoascus sp. VKM F-4517 (FW-2822)]